MLALPLDGGIVDRLRLLDASSPVFSRLGRACGIMAFFSVALSVLYICSEPQVLHLTFLTLPSTSHMTTWATRVYIRTLGIDMFSD